MVVVDVQDYPALLEFLKGGQDDQQFRKALAWKAFQHVLSYDSAASEWLWKQTGEGTLPLLILLNYISRLTLKIAFMRILMWTFLFAKGYFVSLAIRCQEIQLSHLAYEDLCDLG